MSFDIYFSPCRLGNTPEEFRNPFTGEVQSALPREPLISRELKAVRKVLKEASAQHPHEGFYSINFSDGGAAEIFGDDLSEGCMVAVRGITRDLLRFLIDLLKAANWFMSPVMEESIALTSSPERTPSVPDHYQIIVCDSVEGLGQLLAGGFLAWKKYRDQVMGEGS